MKIKVYIKNNLLAIDQLVNTLIGGAPDETLSSRAYRADAAGRPWGKIMRPTIDWIFAKFDDHDHCYRAFRGEVNMSQHSESFRRLVD